MSSTSEDKGTRGYVTKPILQEMLNSLEKRMMDHFDLKLESLLQPVKDDIQELKTTIETKDKEIQKAKEEVAKAREELETLTTSNKELGSKVEVLEKFQVDAIKSFKQLEDKVEERTNRQMRQTLVIKGLPEKDGESWQDTRNLLAKHIANN